MLRKLSHPLTLKMIDEHDNSLLLEPSGRTRLVSYIVTEFCPNGTLKELLYYNGQPFVAPIARYLFKGLIEMIQVVHNEGIVHRDINHENIVFDATFNPKLVDFDTAILEAGGDKSDKNIKPVIMSGFMPPEN